MATSPTYPGVYIEEVPSSVRTIAGVATSITAFIGRARQGPLNDPIHVQSLAEAERTFGGLWRESMLGYSLQQFFLNGGTDALIVRVFNPGGTPIEESHTRFNLPGAAPLVLRAANPGIWAGRLGVAGEGLELFVDHETSDPADTLLFNLTVNLLEGAVVSGSELHRNLSVDPASPRYVETVLELNSSWVRLHDAVPVPAERPDENLEDADGRPIPATISNDGSDGDPIGFAQVADGGLQAQRRGLWALDEADLFNLLCIPPFDREVDVDFDSWTAALAYARSRRAMVLVDPPLTWTEPSAVLDDIGSPGPSVPTRGDNGIAYFPRIRMSDPRQENRLATFAPSGAIAGIIARTDANRGVWKAPAGEEARMSGVRELAYKMTDGENGRLNPVGINCLRTFRGAGTVVWGARTLEGADRLASQWKYIPVRRLGFFIEESLFRGTKWVIFEPNDEPLWAQIRLNVGAFMHNLFRQGAFQGSSPRDAYFVKCDSETTTQNDIDRGIVNLMVGFAPLKPAEFLIIKISQIAGDLQT